MIREFMAGPLEGHSGRRTYFTIDRETRTVEIRNGLDSVIIPIEHLFEYFDSLNKRELLAFLLGGFGK